MEDEDFSNDQYLNYLEQSFTSNILKIYFDENIKEPKYYRPLLNRISSLGQYDQIHIVMNSYGGNLDGTLAILDALENTQAKVNCEIQGTVASAGSIIALSCENIYVSPYAEMMIHSASFGGSGHQSAVMSRLAHIDTRVKKLMQNVYQDFLTPAELEEVFLGKEYWFDSDEIIARLERRDEIINKRLKKEERELKKKVKNTVVEPEEVF